MFDKLFNKKNPDSKVTRDVDTSNGVSALRIVAKQTLLFATIAKELHSLNSAFTRYLKLHNIQPTIGEKISDVSKSLSESKEIKVANIKVKKYGKEKKRTFLAGIFDTILLLIKGLFLTTLFATGYVVYKIIEFITPYVEEIFNQVSEGITLIAEGIKSFFTDFDWLDAFETGFAKYLNFLSFGLLKEEQVYNLVGEAGSFYKEMIRSIGGFIKSAVDWLAPKLQELGRYFAKDVLGVDVDKIVEKQSAQKELYKRSQEMQKQYDELDKKDKELTGRKTKLSEQKSKLEKTAKEKKPVEEKKKEEVKPTPVVKKEEVKPEPTAKKEEVKPVPTVKKEAVKPSPKPAEVPPTPAPSPGTQDGAITPSKEKAEGGVSLQSFVKVMPGVDIANLAPEFANRIALMAKDFYEVTKTKLQINSGYRSPEKQKQLYEEYLAKGGKNNPNLAPVAKPGVSYHEKKVAVDIQATSQPKGTGSPKGFLNELAGYVDEPTGWLEKYGLSRPVTSAKVGPKRKEDWHVQIAGSIPTPDAPEGSSTATDSQGKPTDVSSGKPETGTELSKNSSEVSKKQREQSKPTNPTYIDARTKNNSVAETKRTNVVAPA